MKIEIEVSDKMIEKFISKMEIEEKLSFSKEDIVKKIKLKLYDDFSDEDLDLLDEILWDMYNNEWFEYEYLDENEE